MTDLTLYMPYRDARATLPRALAALADLPPDRVEVVLVDDASTDGGRALVEEFAASRPNTLPLALPSHMGVGCASDEGIAAASGRYVQRSDADDEVIAEGVMEALEAALARSAEVVLQPWWEVSSGTAGPLLRDRSGRTAGGSWLRWPPAIWTVMARRGMLESRALRFPRLSIGEDKIWFLRLLTAVGPERVLHTDTPSYIYRKHANGASSPGPGRVDEFLDYVVRLDRLLWDYRDRELAPEQSLRAAALKAWRQGVRLLKRVGRTDEARTRADGARTRWGWDLRMFREVVSLAGLPE